MKITKSLYIDKVKGKVYFTKLAMEVCMEHSSV